MADLLVKFFGLFLVGEARINQILQQPACNFSIRQVN